MCEVKGATLKHTPLQILQIYKYLQYVFIANKKLQILQIFVKFANIEIKIVTNYL